MAGAAHQQTAAVLRLQSDLKAIKTEPPDGCSASPHSEDNLFVWSATIFGPDETAWEGSCPKSVSPRCDVRPANFHPSTYPTPDPRGATGGDETSSRIAGARASSRPRARPRERAPNLAPAPTRLRARFSSPDALETADVCVSQNALQTKLTHLRKKRVAQAECFLCA